MARSELPDCAAATDALFRRSMAGLVDFSLAVGPWFVLLRAMAVRFSFERDAFGVPLFDAVEQHQIDRLESESNWALQLGDTLFYLPGLRPWFAIGTLLALVAVVFIAVPLNTEGRSIGKKILGLQIATTEGYEPAPLDYLLRTLGGVVDAAPFFLPGLLGWFLASRHDLHQRLGDRMAGTVVIDLLAPLPRPSSLASPADHDESPAAVDSPPPPIPINAINGPGPDPAEADMTVISVEDRLGLQDGTVATLNPNGDSPTWSEEWEAWLHWDRDTQQWFEHDPETDEWLALPPEVEG